MRRSFLLSACGLALGAGLAAFTQPAAAQPARDIPPDQFEGPPPPPPGPRYIWERGHWHWNGVAYVWIRGHYIIRDPRWRGEWIPGHWRGTYWVPGHWE